MSIGELHIIEELVKELFKIFFQCRVSIIVWMISWKEHLPLIVHSQNVFPINIIFLLVALLTMFIILGKHITIRKIIVPTTWIQISTITLLDLQMRVSSKAKGCKTSMVEALMEFYLMNLMIIYLAICLII